MAKNSQKNKMQVHNLAIILGPTMFNNTGSWELITSSTEPYQNLASKMVCLLFEYIIEYWTLWMQGQQVIRLAWVTEGEGIQY